MNSLKPNHYFNVFHIVLDLKSNNTLLNTKVIIHDYDLRLVSFIRLYGCSTFVDPVCLKCVVLFV